MSLLGLLYRGAELALDSTGLTPSSVPSCPFSPCLWMGVLLWAALLPGRWGACCRCLTEALAYEWGPVAVPGSDGDPLHRQMLLYSQEVEEDYNPCEEDLFVL